MYSVAAPPPGTALLVVDGAYLEIGLRERGIDRLNYGLLIKTLEQQTGCRLTERWYVTDRGGDGHHEHSMDIALSAVLPAPDSRPAFRVHRLDRKRSTCNRCNQSVQVQMGVDISIATLILKHAFLNLSEKIVLLTGDSDFFEAIRMVRDERQKEVVLVGMRPIYNSHSVSTKILTLCSQTLWVDDMLDQLDPHYFRQNHRQQQQQQLLQQQQQLQQLLSQQKQQPPPQQRYLPPQMMANSSHSQTHGCWTCSACSCNNATVETICSTCETPKSAESIPATIDPPFVEEEAALVGMGFAQDGVREALKSCGGSVGLALEYLCK
eukprot:gnl/Hemi2/8241_TR2841_c0_g3_i1.p1 gnl/Hemi2/8241_TR2841_c0_g3~~gnl/Hemi2/8241_TR2841_c0_g3_i1.p1  ORF type:complete len:331 (-),score=16.13 gnl/Hemi2/8241_TR2841_c0_g3_i1:35-1003(-)